MRRGLRPVLLMASLVIAMACPRATDAASLLEKNFWLSGPRYHSKLPDCGAPPALERIASRFASKESRFWNSNLRIVEFLRVHETGYNTWATDTIPRRFCSGVALISDGRKRRVHYSIIEDQGMIGASWGVEWCVVGLDRNWAYNPACRMAQP